MTTTDFAFRVCRGCLTADCINPLSSIFNHKQLARTAEKLQKLSGIEVGKMKHKQCSLHGSNKEKITT